MKVFKFGGASIINADRIRNVKDILARYPDEHILVVISAMGKTTNELEKVAKAFYGNQPDEAIRIFDAIKSSHVTIAKLLLEDNYKLVSNQLRDFCIEIEWLLQKTSHQTFDYYYDQIVSMGELFSTAIISAFLTQELIANTWIDVRDILVTDDSYRDANIDWHATRNKVVKNIIPLFKYHSIVITQGFIGATDENESTTLGREGSDYSAAVFANLLDATSLTIWKDVIGMMNADPKDFPEAILIKELNYDEVIEMAYYGAQVIHPKTIRPLQNKGIPLYVKCFLDQTEPGTLIHNKAIDHLPPLIVIKQNQVLVNLHSKDFSFVGQRLMADLYQLFSDLRIKPNLLQSGAVTLQVCLDDQADKIEQFTAQATSYFNIEIEKGLTLLTIRHYGQDSIGNLVRTNDIVLRQQTPHTVQILMKAIKGAADLP